MGSKINRIGEKRINNFGSEMIIIGYRTNKDIDVYFPEYDWTFKNSAYKEFKNGKIKCPYERRYYVVGYSGEGKYKVKENGKHTRVYKTWSNMLKRCYDPKLHKKRPTYKDCEVSEELHNFQNFAKWYEDNYYEVEGERMCLDKDILVKGNKIYSPETCIFVPNTINLLFTKSDKARGKSVIGTHCCINGKYQVRCSLINPKTLYPNNYFKSVWVIAEKASDAELLSNILFMMDIEKGIEYIKDMQNIKVIWLTQNDEIITN